MKNSRLTNMSLGAGLGLAVALGGIGLSGCATVPPEKGVNLWTESSELALFKERLKKDGFNEIAPGPKFFQFFIDVREEKKARISRGEIPPMSTADFYGKYKSPEDYRKYFDEGYLKFRQLQ